MTRQVTVRFHGRLEDFLPPARRGQALTHGLLGRPAVKDVLESLGPPHVEVALLLVDGTSVGFGHRLEGGERVEAFPEAPAPGPLAAHVPLAPPPPEPLRFALDVGLGRLAPLLRLLGFDALWRNDWEDAALARVTAGEGRVLLTRDVGLLKRGEVLHGYFPRAPRPDAQLLEVARRYGLWPRLRPFTRCLACNGPLCDAPPGWVAARVPPRVRERHARFLACEGCGRVYWEGSHHARMLARLEALGAQLAP
jgi:uncharacterized protein with PIN domain